MSSQRKLDWSQVNDAKANFDRIYVCDDPREYYRILYGLDYVIPDLAKGVFRNTVAALEELRGRPIKVLDLGCSYGINAALIRYPLDIDRLASRYRDLDAVGVPADELARLDKQYFASWPGRDVEIVGLDISAPAVKYATSVGLLNDGAAIDLESGPPTDDVSRMLKGVDLVISTGCVGYISEKTFASVLAAIDGPAPWIASFVLRMFPYERISGLLKMEAGLNTEKLDGVTFVQRRFRSEVECREVLAALDARGIPTDGKESEGLYHAEFFLSRSPADCERVPLDTVATVTSGEHRSYGRRWQRFDDEIRFGR